MSLLDEAILFATETHKGQVRRFSNSPYILHPLEVASIISTMTNNQEVMAAGCLHDTIEDCGIQSDEIRERFGDRVCELVLSETESEKGTNASDTWKRRKECSLAVLKNTSDRDIKILWLADKLSNIRSFYREYEKLGDMFWLQLHQPDIKMQEWYYRSIAACTSDLSDTMAYREYLAYVDYLFPKKDKKDL